MSGGWRLCGISKECERKKGGKVLNFILGT